jgi:hypothetical protein
VPEIILKIFFQGLPIVASLNFGLTVALVIQIFGHISYAIINPAVAIAAAVHQLISIRVKKYFIKRSCKSFKKQITDDDRLYDCGNNGSCCRLWNSKRTYTV